MEPEPPCGLDDASGPHVCIKIFAESRVTMRHSIIGQVVAVSSQVGAIGYPCRRQLTGLAAVLQLAGGGVAPAARSNTWAGKTPALFLAAIAIGVQLRVCWRPKLGASCCRRRCAASSVSACRQLQLPTAKLDRCGSWPEISPVFRAF